MTSTFNIETYFNSEFDLFDFFDVVESFDVPITSEVVQIKEEKSTERPLKKQKKTYAIQIMELKQEIMELRQEVEMRDAQLLSLIRQKTS